MSMSHKEMIAVIQAHQRGEVVQYQMHGTNDWQERGGAPSACLFNFYSYDYRIKPTPPKPREWWLNLYPYANRYCVHESRVAAEKNNGGRIELIHVVEVLP